MSDWPAWLPPDVTRALDALTGSGVEVEAATAPQSTRVALCGRAVDLPAGGAAVVVSPDVDGAMVLTLVGAGFVAIGNGYYRWQGHAVTGVVTTAAMVEPLRHLCGGSAQCRYCGRVYACGPCAGRYCQTCGAPRARPLNG